MGLIRRLDYLAGLGVSCLWWMPFQTSPRRDYCSVDPCFGTLGDFVDFIRVIIDLVVNHTSDRHPWFQESRRDKRSKYRDYYVRSKKRPKDAHTGRFFRACRTTSTPKTRTSFTHERSEDPRGRHQLVMKPYGYGWYRLGGLGYLLDRRDD